VVDVRTEIEIDRPRADVAEYASNPDNARTWYEHIKDVSWSSTKPLEVGSRIVFGAQFLGKRLDYVYEIKELDPGRRLVMATAEGPFPMETTYAWEDTASGGTKMSLRNRGRPKGFSRVTSFFLTRAMRKANTRDLERLKAVLER
jgi:uncharacterized membrane protein